MLSNIVSNYSMYVSERAVTLYLEHLNLGCEAVSWELCVIVFCVIPNTCNSNSPNFSLNDQPVLLPWPAQTPHRDQVFKQNHRALVYPKSNLFQDC